MAKDYKIPMSIVDIQECIPHRYPILLVDRIVEFSKDKFVKGIKNVTMTDPIIQGHFPGNPVWPGVLIVEGAAQTAAVFGVLCAEDTCTSFLLAEITSTRFRRPVVPGDTMLYDLQLKKRRGAFFWFDATVSVDSAVVAELSFSARLQ